MARLENRPNIERLYGIGECLSTMDIEGRPVQIIRHDNGDVEVHGSTDGFVTLPHAVAQMCGAFMAGQYLMSDALAERLSDMLGGGLVFDWVHIDADDYAVGRSIADLDVRRRTGATIVAVLQGVLPIVDPDPEVCLSGGDELIVVGRDVDRADLIEYLERGS